MQPVYIVTIVTIVTVVSCGYSGSSAGYASGTGLGGQSSQFQNIMGQAQSYGSGIGSTQNGPPIHQSNMQQNWDSNNNNNFNSGQSYGNGIGPGLGGPSQGQQQQWTNRAQSYSPIGANSSPGSSQSGPMGQGVGTPQSYIGAGGPASPGSSMAQTQGGPQFYSSNAANSRGAPVSSMAQGATGPQFYGGNDANRPASPGPSQTGQAQGGQQSYNSNGLNGNGIAGSSMGGSSPQQGYGPGITPSDGNRNGVPPPQPYVGGNGNSNQGPFGNSQAPLGGSYDVNPSPSSSFGMPQQPLSQDTMPPAAPYSGNAQRSYVPAPSANVDSTSAQSYSPAPSPVISRSQRSRSSSTRFSSRKDDSSAMPVLVHASQGVICLIATVACAVFFM